MSVAVGDKSLPAQIPRVPHRSPNKTPKNTAAFSLCLLRFEETISFRGLQIWRRAASERNMLRAILVILMLSLATVAQSLVRGTVYDWDNAVLPGFVIRASSGKRVVETKTNEAGRYLLRLPSGIYTLDARWEPRGYWHPFRRSEILIKGDGEYEVDLWPTQRILSTWLVVTNRGVSEPTTLSRAPRYKEYSFAEQKRIKLILQYLKSNRSGTKFENVILTYNEYTIHAEVVEVDVAARRMTLQGNVRFSGESKAALSKQATLLLKRESPELTINGKAYSLGIQTDVP